jgi:iron(III) transport system ATP-binding protein
MKALEFRAVSKAFAQGSYALNEVSFTARAGQLTTLLGPSGSGKSTLLRLAAGLETPTAGSVLIGDEHVCGLPPEARNVAMVAQSNQLFPHLDVLGNASFGLLRSGVSRGDARRKAAEALRLVGLEGLEDRSCGELSGGQQQRVALARALVIEPAVVLLDEPLSNLDDRLRRQMREEIRSLQQRLGLTVAYVTHDQAEAMAISDHVVIISHGRLVQEGSPRQVYERPINEFVASFMGDAALFDVAADQDGVVRLGTLAVPAVQTSTTPGLRYRLMVRPEAWHMLPASAQGLAGRVLRCAYMGHRAEYTVDAEVGTLLVTTHDCEALLQIGAPVTLQLSGHGLTLFPESGQ